ncbi:unnamed protein product [Bemisia tabaci]|uniref:Activating signal cointegrator 1 complex subunit 3 n=1 Tax=Bemisia tabaci TaxID=7038 RepID=A0A9P0A5M5_BEMTA|nr:unnamed protein product [Bemisia tabaci]
MSMEDFIVSVSATLESNHSNDELQNELFDLIGFDHFELVSCLLEHRNDIVNNCKVEEYECNQMNVALNNRGYVAGKQMTLPEGVTRKDNKTYEEVSIPVSEPPPLNVGSKLVSIASLDEVGQQAFAGVQNLNRIQSIVFQTAYHTNENLLICAPTGAGKTNVALLTIVSTIRNFIRAEKININEFKVNFSL